MAVAALPVISKIFALLAMILMDAYMASLLAMAF
jgi:hypothetical protein